MILFFDTETTGMAEFRLPSDDPRQPHLVQLAALLTEYDGTERASVSLIIDPDGYTIPDPAAAVHGITTPIASNCGVPAVVALRLFTDLLKPAELVVAHNINFDRIIIEAALSRLHRRTWTLAPTNTFCTMKAATPICKIPHARSRSPTDYKWPKLEECIRHFFDEDLEGAHDALVDVRACARVYFHLQEMGVTA